MSNRFSKDFEFDGHPICDSETGIKYFNCDKNSLIQLLNDLSDAADRVKPKKPPKIKLTKALPSEPGKYYLTLLESGLPFSISVVDVALSEDVLFIDSAEFHYKKVEYYDGWHWAKLEQSQFEFGE